MKNFKPNSVLVKNIKNYLLVVFGTAVLAFGISVFIIPFDLVIGGVAGIGIVLKMVLPFDFLTVDVYIAITTWLLFFLGLIFLGKSFAAKTLISSIIYPPLITLFNMLMKNETFSSFFNLADSEYGAVAVLMSAIFGGALIGAGCAITFKGGGSTGGTDILAFILSKKIKKLRSSVAVFAVDATVIALGLFATKDFVLTLFAIISAFVGAVSIDKIFLDDSSAYIAQIITPKYEEINAGVISKMERTSTIISIKGGYSGEESKMLMVTFSMRQYAELMSIINNADKNAFVTMHRAHEVNGEGWEGLN